MYNIFPVLNNSCITRLYTHSFRLLNGYGASGEIDSSIHSRRAADFLEGSGGSAARMGADGNSGFEDDLELSEGSWVDRGSGSLARHGNAVTKHDDASQTEDREFSPRGRMQYSDTSTGVWRRDPRGHSASAADEVDSSAIGQGCQGNREQKDRGHARGAGAVGRFGPGNRGRTREWIEENPPMVEDFGVPSEGRHASDSPHAAKPPHTNVRWKPASAFTHVADTSAHGSTDITQVRNSL